MTKGFILGAGLGTRLAALGLDLPKVMLPIGGKPLLEHHLELFRSQGITEICVNLHYKPEAVRDCFQDGSRWGVRLTYSHEPELLGTAGAVRKMKDWIGRDPCLIFYGDTLVRTRFDALAGFHAKRKAALTMGVYDSPEPWTGGVVQLDPEGRVVYLVEKPPREQCRGSIISAGIFLAEPDLIELIPEGRFSDFGKDVFPIALARHTAIYALRLEGYIQDVGTPERYAKAQADFAAGRVA